MLENIQQCFAAEKVLYSRHARDEMEHDEFGEIRRQEVDDAIAGGKVIESYPDDEPYPSCLIYGRTSNNRPLHVVCAYAGDSDVTVIVTVYQPDPGKWMDFQRRKS